MLAAERWWVSWYCGGDGLKSEVRWWLIWLCGLICMYNYFYLLWWTRVRKCNCNRLAAAAAHTIIIIAIYNRVNKRYCTKKIDIKKLLLSDGSGPWHETRIFFATADSLNHIRSLIVSLELLQSWYCMYHLVLNKYHIISYNKKVKLNC